MCVELRGVRGGPYSATRAGSWRVCLLVEDVCTSSLQEPFASRPETCLTLSSAKTLAHPHRQPRSSFSRSRTVGSYFPVLLRILIRKARPIPFRRSTEPHKRISLT